MNLIYVAGPYSADTYIGIERNVLNAKEATIELLRHGWAVICPHTMTHTCQNGTGLEPEVFYASDLEMLRRCDAILLLKGWQDSKGSVEEMALARELGLSVFATLKAACDMSDAYAAEGKS